MEEILLVEKNGEIRQFKGAGAIRLATRFMFVLAALCFLVALVQLFRYVSQTREIKRLTAVQTEMTREIGALEKALEKTGHQAPAAVQTAPEPEQDMDARPRGEGKPPPEPAGETPDQDEPVPETGDAEISLEEEPDAPDQAESAVEPAQATPAEKEDSLVFTSLPGSEKGQADRVSVRRFETVVEDGGKSFRIQFSIKNTSSDGAPLKGRGFVILKNRAAEIDKLVLPAAGLKNDLPHPPSSGFSYSVANFGTISLKSLDKSYLNRFDAADLILFDTDGALLFRQSFSTEKQ